MTLESQKKLAQHIIRLLKVSEIVIPIGRTSKGNLGLKFSSNTDDFEIMLDAVPLPTRDSLNDENNIELKKMIEKYYFGNTSNDILHAVVVGGGGSGHVPMPEEKDEPITNPPKKRGRPKKVK